MSNAVALRSEYVDAAKRIGYKTLCEDSHLFFTRYFCKLRWGSNFRVNWHHIYICDAVDDILLGTKNVLTDGEQNLLITVSPGSSKTELCGINLMARGLAIQPRSRFLYLSYGDDLALLQSAAALEIVKSDEYQAFWPMDGAQDRKSIKRWNIEINGYKAGGVYAVSLGGQITGFRAGQLEDGVYGCLIVDDPMKAKEAYSTTAQNQAIIDLVGTVRSRKANPKTPVIIIMQRLAENDPAGYVLNHGLDSFGKWKHIDIPALITDEYVKTLPEKYRSEIDSSNRDEKGRFSYWPHKEPLELLLLMESGNSPDDKINRFTFSSQYMQRPTPLGGGILKGAYFKRYAVLPKMKMRKIFSDTAMKTGERNDFSVFECWGQGVDGGVYLIDMIRGKWEAPELKRRAIAFWAKHKDHTLYQIEQFGVLRSMLVEDKASGTGLIQDIRSQGKIPIMGIPRTVDKLTRVMEVVSYIESGYVYIPESAPFTNDFVAECEAFTADDSHKHDDQIDPMIDAINNMLANAGTAMFRLKLGGI